MSSMLLRLSPMLLTAGLLIAGCELVTDGIRVDIPSDDDDDLGGTPSPKPPCGGDKSTYVWNHAFGDTLYEQTWGLTLDDDGNVVVGGFWRSENSPQGLDLGCGKLAHHGQSQTHAYLGKLSASDGECLWSTTIQGTNDSSTQLLWNAAVDDEGNVVIVGEYTGDIDFDGNGTPDGPRTMNDDVYMFVASYSADGHLRWGKTFGSQDAEVAAYGATVDGHGDPVLVGRFHGSPVDFGGGKLLQADGSDAFVVHLAKEDGSTQRWAQLGGIGNQSGSYVAVDGDGNVVVAGLDFDAVQGVYGDIFVASLSENPAEESWHENWRETFGDDDGQVQQVLDVDVLESGDVVVAGWFSRALNLGTSHLQTAAARAGFAARLHRDDGSELWARSWGESGQGAFVNSMAIDGSDRIVLGGGFYGALDVGDCAGVLDAGVTDAKDAFLAVLDSDGTDLWAYRFGDNQIGPYAGQEIERTATNANGDIAVAGRFYGNINLGGGDIACATCTAQNLGDEFVAVFSR